MDNAREKYEVEKENLKLARVRNLSLDFCINLDYIFLFEKLIHFVETSKRQVRQKDATQHFKTYTLC